MSEELVTTDDENETDDCGSSSVVSTTMADRDCMTKDIIAMILQYMDATGFEQSYKTFWNECITYGYPLPQLTNLTNQQLASQQKEEEERTPRSALLNFGPRESNLLFKYFDCEEANLLLEQWTKFILALGEEQEEDFKKITFFVRIFASIIPFRRNESIEKKNEALAGLRELFQKKSDEFSTDEKMLSLFALPFVADPAVHPVFKEIFQDSWKSKLRLQMNLSIKRFFQFNNVPMVSSCDLVQLYRRRKRTTTIRMEDDDEFEEDEEDGCLGSSRCQHSRSASLSANTKTVYEDLKKAESTLLDVELRYHKLLKVTAEMVAALEAVVEGRDQDMSALRGRVTSVFPELFTAFQQQQQKQKQQQHQQGSGDDGQQGFQVEVNSKNDDDVDEEEEEDDDSFSEPDDDYDTESERDQDRHQNQVMTNNNRDTTTDNFDPPADHYDHDGVEIYNNTDNSNRDSSPKYENANSNSKNNDDDGGIYYEPTPRPRGHSFPKSCHRPHLRTLRRPSSKFNVHGPDERENCGGRGDDKDNHKKLSTTCTIMSHPSLSTRRSETRAIDKRQGQCQPGTEKRDPSQRQYHNKNNDRHSNETVEEVSCVAEEDEEEGRGRGQNHHQQQQNSPKKRSYSQSVHLTRSSLSSGRPSPPPPSLSMGSSSSNNNNTVMDTNNNKDLSSVNNRKRWVVSSNIDRSRTKVIPLSRKPSKMIQSLVDNKDDDKG